MEGIAAASPLARLRVALAHDSFAQWGGAVRVVAVLHAVFPQTPTYTIAVTPRILPAALVGTEFRTSFLQGRPGMPDLRAYRRYLPFLPGAAPALRPRGFDPVLSSSSALGPLVPDASHVAYVHNTMRFARDFEGYVGATGCPAPVRSAGRTAAGCLREWDRRAGARPALLIAYSTVVAGRIRRRWGRKAAVLPPPVDAWGIARGRAPVPLLRAVPPGPIQARRSGDRCSDHGR